jgi:hypothetical protein
MASPPGGDEIDVPICARYQLFSDVFWRFLAVSEAIANLDLAEAGDHFGQSVVVNGRTVVE